MPMAPRPVARKRMLASCVRPESTSLPITSRQAVGLLAGIIPSSCQATRLQSLRQELTKLLNRFRLPFGRDEFRHSIRGTFYQYADDQIWIGTVVGHQPNHARQHVE